MTMDVGSSGARKIELKSDHVQICEEQTDIMPIKVAKRPFDVAFLMLPDDKLKQKQLKKLTQEITYVNHDDDDEDEEIEVGTNSQDFKPRFFQTQKQQIFDDPNLIKAKNLEDLRGGNKSTSAEQKSAFTKVNLASKDLRLSPNLSISPDLSYQNSLSPSPPIINRNFNPNMLSPNQLFKNHHHHHHHHQQQQQQQQQQAYQNSFLHQPENFNPALENPFLLKAPSGGSEMGFPKIRPTMYRPEMYNYQQFPNHQEMLKMSNSNSNHPAAAILTSLLPPSLAALSLPAQNVCAKCNISFRMTSDLVYHMRSHHKNDSVDMHKRRREEKLKCPVCAESFRERHHLTRHMTAHQDKEEDEAGGVKKKCV